MKQIAESVLMAIRNSVYSNKLPSENSTPSYRNPLYQKLKSQGRAAKNQVSTYTANVNMLLTGKLINSLRIASLGKKTATLSFGADQTEKIVKNERWGRSIRTLSKENIRIIENQAVADINKKLKKYLDNNKTTKTIEAVI